MCSTRYAGSWGWTLWRLLTCELLGAQLPRRRRPRLKIIGGCQITAKGARSAVSRDWRSGATDSSGRGCGKHLGHRTARCSLRGNSSSCSARPQPYLGFPYGNRLGAVQLRGQVDLARTMRYFRIHADTWRYTTIRRDTSKYTPIHDRYMTDTSGYMQIHANT